MDQQARQRGGRSLNLEPNRLIRLDRLRAGDDALTARDALALDLDSVRLVVASACESGLIGGLDAADEALALGNVLIGAGAAGVVSSLWKVDDQATAMLMTRFYDELDKHGRPARALRAAMLWLRDASDAQLGDYWQAHPELRASPGATDGDPGPRTARSFRAPTMWAGFVFNGA